LALMAVAQPQGAAPELCQAKRCLCVTQGML
jgi:hypothetical protein